ncbi:hypothetical protein [Agarivorans sp. 1_MG-2023]|uniref:hypothetical protein n=1 Tax=Agarivorans sp. 1_MG-2023 TaxID=3062634 RepID=UPI0026E48734|nr:hypothetical protein [Agarivorans sp. 1_MG-2023]MDO6765950.1 hypothetical protein [Agarivorans sp. 1_MG-2023]
MTSEEIREWIKFFVIIIGGAIALRTYIVSQRQRRLDNSIKLLEIFFSHLEEDDISEWKRIFMSSSESSGSKKGFFFSKNNQEIPFGSLFSEGPDDNGATDRIVHQIDLVAYEVLRGTADVRFIYSQIGQLINTTHKWLGGNNSLIPKHYPYFDRLVAKYKKKSSDWPSKVYSYCE